MREREELLNKVDRVALSTKKGTAKEKTTEEHCKEFDKEIDEFSSLEDEDVVKPSKKKKVAMKNGILREQFTKR